jgi:hypothetical protein
VGGAERIDAPTLGLEARAALIDRPNIRLQPTKAAT